MNTMVPYTVILQDVKTGSVSTKVLQAPQDTKSAKEYVTWHCGGASHVVALVKGNHPVIIGTPGAA